MRAEKNNCDDGLQDQIREEKERGWEGGKKGRGKTLLLTGGAPRPNM